MRGVAVGASGQGVGSGVWVHPALSFRESSPHAKAPGSPLLSEPEQLALKTLSSSSSSSLETPPPLAPSPTLYNRPEE